MHKQLSESKQAIDQMQNAFDQGYFKQDENLNIVPVEDPAERAHLASTVKKDREEAARREQEQTMQHSMLNESHDQIGSQLNLNNDPDFQ